jgi:hypothetical protein
MVSIITGGSAGATVPSGGIDEIKLASTVGSAPNEPVTANV